MNLRIDSVESKFYELGTKFMNFNIKLSTRVLLLDLLVRSRLNYACQTWTLTARQTERVESTHTSFLRKMLRRGSRKKDDQWNYIMSNEHILVLCKSRKIEDIVNLQQRRYVAHIIRCIDESLSKKLLFNCAANDTRDQVEI